MGYLWLLIVLPLLGSLTLLAVGKRISERMVGILAVLMVGAPFAIAVFGAAGLLIGADGGSEVIAGFSWIPALGIDAQLLWDPLSAVMAVVVTGVGLLIHIYAIGYMHGDSRFGRFFTYLNLFIAAMLILVLGENFGVLFIGWELVGASSYLLISFWFEKPTAAAAGRKAFVVNRIGDLGFLVALMIIFAQFGTLSFGPIFEDSARVLTSGTATAITLLLLIGAAGKSAQLPLYVWLPDAMEGPTPVSALIHAATMVTAGVYMVARTGALFELAPFSAAAVATMGAVTALFAATIAIGQRNIKRILAYSTISQLGYMFMGVGVTAYAAGIFHLVTHAFFKALLFLGAGSVIHAMNKEEDLWKMGGLRKKMPVTFVTMMIAWLAIAGLPPMSGFFSKDEILAATFSRGGGYVVLWLMGIVVAGLTAFYMSRLMFLTFFGKPRWGAGIEPRESPPVMTMPLVALAVLSVVGGLIQTPFHLGSAFGPGLEHFLEPSFELVQQVHLPSAGVQWLLAFTSVGVAAIGILYAYRRYLAGTTPLPEQGGIWDTLLAGYGVDQLYGKALVLPGKELANAAAFSADVKIIDGAVNGVGLLVKRSAAWLRPIQSGLARSYGAGILVGTLGLVIWLIVAGGGI